MTSATAEPVLSVIVPCFNEESNLRELVDRLEAVFALHSLPVEILLVDDASRDGTWALIRELAAARPSVHGLHHDTNRGIVGGWRTGLDAASAPAVVITDADLQYAPEDIPRLFHILTREAPDVVQGWRIAHNFRDTYRYLLSLAFSFLLNRLFGTQLRDIKSGFLCTRREVLAEMLSTRYRYRFLQHFVVVNAVSKGRSVRQEPVLFWSRHAGESFIRSPLRFGLASLADLPRAFWEFRVLNPRERRAVAAASAESP
jgi:glycosyltransferase involved in cell wall biosynthesis